MILLENTLPTEYEQSGVPYERRIPISGSWLRI